MVTGKVVWKTTTIKGVNFQRYTCRLISTELVHNTPNCKYLLEHLVVTSLQTEIKLSSTIYYFILQAENFPFSFRIFKRLLLNDKITTPILITFYT